MKPNTTKLRVPDQLRRRRRLPTGFDGHLSLRGAKFPDSHSVLPGCRAPLMSLVNFKTPWTPPARTRSNQLACCYMHRRLGTSRWVIQAQILFAGTSQPLAPFRPSLRLMSANADGSDSPSSPRKLKIYPRTGDKGTSRYGCLLCTHHRRCCILAKLRVPFSVYTLARDGQRQTSCSKRWAQWTS
jgi:hypothetical protein